MAPRKKIIRCVLKEIIVDIYAEKEQLTFIIHWHGGSHSTLTIPRPLSAVKSHKTAETGRLTVLMLIAHLVYTASFILRSKIEEKKLQHQFQSNSTKTRRVLSLIYLALLVIRFQTPLPIVQSDLDRTIAKITTTVREHVY